MKALIEYTDYRVYLKECLAALKESGTKLTNRSFAHSVGVASSSWLTEVLGGTKGISKSLANKISQALHHSKKESRYFETLVSFNQAKTVDERNFYYRELTALKSSVNPSVVNKDQYDYYTTWYHSVIRSLIGIVRFKSDFKGLAQLVSPPITPAQAKQSIKLLESLGFIHKKDDGYYEIKDRAITTGDYGTALAISNFQQETMKLAFESLDRYPKQERDISTVTMGISRQGFEKIKEEANAFRRKIIAIANEDSNIERVFQMNLQLFPVSRIKPETEVKP
jgi:uncharacterized protein (TIGR02147 family)